MKSTIKQKKSKDDSTFPRLMKGKSGVIILATNITDENSMEGTVVHITSNSPYSLGDHDINWARESFVDFTGSVTLEN